MVCEPIVFSCLLNYLISMLIKCMQARGWHQLIAITVDNVYDNVQTVYFGGE
jgi:hypothetical protein